MLKKITNKNTTADNVPEQDPDSILKYIKPLIESGKTDGYITYDDLNKALPVNCSEEIYTTVISFLEDFDITVLKASKSPSSAIEPDGEEVEEKVEDEVFTGATQNATNLYMTKMSNIPLLTKENEINIAKRIEDGKNGILQSTLKIPHALNKIITLYDEILNGQILLRDVIEVDALYRDLHTADDVFIQRCIGAFRANNIEVMQQRDNNFYVETNYKALPDTLESFNTMFINPKTGDYNNQSQ